jgi:hypothetical protein
MNNINFSLLHKNKMYLVWISLGICLMISSVIILFTDWIIDDSNEVKSLRTLSELGPLTMAEFLPEHIPVSTDEVYTLTPTLGPFVYGTYTPSDRTYFEAGEAWFGASWTIPQAEDPPFNYSAATFPGMTYNVIFQLIGVGESYVKLEILTSGTFAWRCSFQTETAISLLDWVGSGTGAGFPYTTLSKDTVYGATMTMQTNGDDNYEVTIYIFEPDGTLVHSATQTAHESVAGTWLGAGAPSDHICTYALNNGRIHASSVLKTHVTQQESWDSLRHLMNYSIEPWVEYAPLILYRTFAISRNVITHGTTPITSFSSVDVNPLTIHASNGTLSGVINTVQETPVIFNVNVNGIADYNIPISYTVLAEPSLIYPTTFTGLINEAVEVAPTLAQSVTFDDPPIIPDLPTGLSFALVEDAETGITKGTIHGQTTQTVNQTYVVQVVEPTPVDGDTPVTYTNNQLNIQLKLELQVSADSGLSVFDYQTTEANPLLCFQSFTNRYWNHQPYAVFSPTHAENFHQFAASLPPNLSLNTETGAVEGIPVSMDTNEVQSITVTASSKTSGIQYTSTLHLLVVQNLSQLEYQSVIYVDPTADISIEPDTITGRPLSMELVGSWPTNSTVDQTGTIHIPQGNITEPEYPSVGVRATTLNELMERRLTLKQGTETKNQDILRYTLGSSLGVLGIGCTAYGAIHYFNT